jgi:RNA polymerase sigma factor (sigma-70 family)
MVLSEPHYPQGELAAPAQAVGRDDQTNSEPRMLDSQQQQFQALMDRVLAGSPEAARELTEEYGPHLLRAVRRRLHRQLRTKFDSRDFVQDVWASFFAALPGKPAFERPEALVGFLAQLARNKVVDAVRLRLMGQKYNVNREQPLANGPARRDGHLPARQPTPSELAASREQWEVFLQKQPLVYRRALALIRDGADPAEAAQAVRVSERTVRRLLQKLLSVVR